LWSGCARIAWTEGAVDERREITRDTVLRVCSADAAPPGRETTRVDLGDPTCITARRAQAIGSWSWHASACGRLTGPLAGQDRNLRWLSPGAATCWLRDCDVDAYLDRQAHRKDRVHARNDRQPGQVRFWIVAREAAGVSGLEIAMSVCLPWPPAETSGRAASACDTRRPLPQAEPPSARPTESRQSGVGVSREQQRQQSAIPARLVRTTVPLTGGYTA